MQIITGGIECYSTREIAIMYIIIITLSMAVGFLLKEILKWRRQYEEYK